MSAKYINRSLELLLPKANERFLILVTGARQVGKTTLLQKQYPTLAYYNLDSIQNREYLKELSEFDWHARPGRAILDEIQKLPDIIDKVKFAWDGGKLERTVLTGSSHILLLRYVRESLAGRARLLELYPLSVAERVPVPAPETLFQSICEGKLHSGALDRTLAPEQCAAFIRAEARSYAWGGMPALEGLEAEARKEWLADYRSTFLQRDLADLARLHDLMPFSSFQRIIAQRSAQILNYADLARDSGISADTAKRYLEYLRISYQTELLQPWFSNPTRRLVKSPKVIHLDMGLLRSASSSWETDSGEFFENFVIAEMIKHIRTLKTDARLWFWRTSGGAEVDAVIDGPRGIWGLEIKNRATAHPGDARHLKSLAAESGTRWLGGFVLYRGKTMAKIADPNIWALPSWRLWSTS
jgi:predicted AAA+ superfamily ATPase